ncbi:MAG: NAD(P)-dependent oxidoreductase [Mesorhizobium sp.]|nr:MAG: NAD(P)-dependent oxidoreductase [Mesorhizobium sp.]
MKIGFVGLGSIGFPVARNLVGAGHDLAVHDLDKSRAAELLELGATWADSPAAAAKDCEALMTSLPGPKEIEIVMASAAPALPVGSIWCDLSTSDLHLTKRLASQLEKRGIASIDAPITGGVPNAYIAKITIFASGKPAAFEKMLPVLEKTAAKVFYFGDVGGATVVKLITNFVAFIHVQALGEGLVLGRKYGLDHIELMQAMKSSYADSFVLRTDEPKLLAGDYSPEFALALACKDFKLSVDLAKELGLKLEVTELTERIYRDTIDRYGPQAGAMSSIRLLEEDTGVHLFNKL